MSSRRLISLVVCLILFSVTAGIAEASGRVEGRLTDAEGIGIGGATVVVQGTAQATVTDRNGGFTVTRVTAGSYAVTFTLGDNSVTEENVSVTSGKTATVDVSVDWDIGFAESVVVYSASRRIERVVDAPAAVTVISEQQIEREASHGQVPKLLEFTPGAEVTQSGVYDYNFNTRGFNSSLNRRVATLIDGRNPSVPFLGAQEWAAIAFPVDDLASIELVRGPSAALYGANASSGVLNLTSKQPRYSQGGQVRLAAGELSTLNADVRWAGSLGGNWYLKAYGGIREGDDFSVSRNVTVEYPGLPMEAVPLAIFNDNEISFGGIRVDRYVGESGLFTLETGTAEISGPLFQTGIGRVQLIDVKRPWARANFSNDHWNVLVYRTERDAPTQLALASGANLALDTNRTTAEVQTNWDFAGDKVRLVAGASATEEEIDTFDPLTGMQSLVFAPIDSSSEALFAQLDFQISERVKLVGAVRGDSSDLHDDQLSPKASVVVSLNDTQTIRFTYNEAFQVANYSEFFLVAPVAPPADLSALEGLCLLSGVTDCGLANPVPVLALGNADLEIEEVTTFEVGYTGIIGGRTFVTADYYTSENENFITDLLPQLGTLPGGGAVNPNFGPWVGSTAAETTPTLCPNPAAITVADCVRALAPPILSNDAGGSAILAAVSYTNFGQVDTQGIDVGVNHFFNDTFSLQFNASWFDFDIKNELPGFDTLLLPNSPEYKGALAVTYDAPAMFLQVAGRWVDDFMWGVGPFQGPVMSYVTADLNGSFPLGDNWSLGFNVSNFFDDEHYQAFGGDLLRRRAIVNTTYSWDN